MAAIFSIIQPIDAAPPKVQKEKSKPQDSPPIVASESVFGKLRGRYAQVLVDFWMGRNNPPDSLNCIIILTARMLPCYFDDPDDAIEFVEGLVDGLPDVSFSNRLTGNGRKEVSRIIRQSVDAVFSDNGRQHDPELSSSKLGKVFAAWQRKGFSLVDRASWGSCSRAVPLAGVDFKWTADELHALTYFGTICCARRKRGPLSRREEARSVVARWGAGCDGSRSARGRYEPRGRGPGWIEVQEAA